MDNRTLSYFLNTFLTVLYSSRQPMRWYIPVHFYRQPSQIYKKKCPIFKNRFFFIIWKYFGKWCEGKCNVVNTHLNHRRIFLFSTPCGVGSLLCTRNINCKTHWLAICCLSRIFFFPRSTVQKLENNMMNSVCQSFFENLFIYQLN